MPGREYRVCHGFERFRKRIHLTLQGLRRRPDELREEAVTDTVADVLATTIVGFSIVCADDLRTARV
jgi:hypothetical protein